MMKNSKLVQLTGLVVLFFIATISCNQESAKSNASANKEFTKVAQAYEDAYNNKDAEAISMLFTEDGSQLPPGANMVEGRENIKNFLQSGMNSGVTNLKIEGDSGEIKGNLGYGVGTFHYDLPAKDSGMITIKGKYVTVMEKMSNGKWLIKYHIYNYDSPLDLAPAPEPKDSI